MLPKHTVTVNRRTDGTFIADDHGRSGSPPTGYGKTWLEALGDYFIQNVERYGATAVVKDEGGKPMPPSFFGDAYRRR